MKIKEALMSKFSMKKVYTIISGLLLVSMHLCATHQIARAVRPNVSSYLGLLQTGSCGRCQDLIAVAQLVSDINIGLHDCCNNLNTDIQHLESVIDTNITHIVQSLNAISNVDLFVSSFETLFSLVESFDQSLLASLITTIKGFDSSFDQVSSLIEYDIEIDQTSLSKISKIDTQVDNIVALVDQLLNQECASTSEVIATSVDMISSMADLIVLVTEQIANVNQTIASKIDKIDTQLDAIESSVDTTIIQCASRSDIIIDNMQSLQEQEASCCVQLSSDVDALQVDINSRLDLIQETIEGLSNVETVISQLSLLVSVIEDLQGALLVSLLDTTVSEFDVVTSQLDALFQCQVIPISSATTITVPGSYCVNNDFVGDIIVASSHVKIDLNNRTITRVSVNSGLSNVSVVNGFLDAGVFDAFTIARGCDGISLAYVEIISGANGVLATGTTGSRITNLSLLHVIVNNCVNNGFLLQECYGNIDSCVAYANGACGFQIQNSDNFYVLLENSQAISNGAEGFLLSNPTSIAVASQYSLNNCTANLNGSYGFNMGSNIAAVNVYVANCIASNNGTSVISDGFFVNNVSVMDSVTGVITNCTAIKNSRTGFNTFQYVYNGNCSTGPCYRVRYTGNYAADNLLITSKYQFTNYAVAGATAVAVNDLPYSWRSWKNANAGSWINTDGNNS